MSRLKTSILLGATVILAVTVPASAADSYKGFERAEALITVQELQQLSEAKDPKLVILGVVEPISFGVGHIPGSVNIWRPDYELKVGQPYPFEGMILDRPRFQDFARGLGIDNDSRVVVYDEQYDATSLWWAFFLYGKTDVRVLDGGYPAWKAAGYPTESFLSGARPARMGDFVARQHGAGWLASMEDVRRAQAVSDVRVWDAREPAEWSGAEKKGNARRAGRIPWATFQNWQEYRTEIDGKATAFKTAAEIQQVIDKFGMDRHQTHIFYCQSGVRSTTAIFALYLMGWSPERLFNYEGSWLEWSYYDQNPLLTGP
jgi:thiosulfate/3-mercaptopyruvate sulfurtransferase